ncbi:MAG TPA: selenocysteine-specific translation elongation factor [Acidimicrobiales bacterium]|nr:selenocysteine-specific translation elongation factor [Acidimicrobiales bacterium]
MHVVATAGHVDHGKSTLVRALTGIDPDRFAEEKERGLTIDLGFAWTTLPSGRELGFVDVPGHVRFLKNMLAGVGAVDACVFVVAATEGWKPQSEEHLRILELLGLGHGLVALTKADLVDADDLELARLDVADRVAGTFLEGAEVVAVDARAGRGVGDLAAAIDRLLTTTPEATDRNRPRLWVDRSFAAKGSGTVVTGTLTGGTLRVDDTLDLLPSARSVRVRALQTHRSKLTSAGPGRRLAVNLTGVSHGEVERGDALVRRTQWAPTQMFDASLTVLAGLDHDVSRRGAYTVHVGSGEHAANIRVLGATALTPGEVGAVRIHLPVPLPLVAGDRFIVRESGRGETVGGGEVLDVAPRSAAARARPDRSVDRVVREWGWIESDHLERLTGERRAADVSGWVVDPTVLAEVRQRLEAAVVDGVELTSLSAQERAVLDTLDGVRLEGGRARRGAPLDDSAAHPYLYALDAAPFSPPTPEEADVERPEVRDLVRRGLVVERDGFHFSATAVDAAARVVASLVAASPDGVTASQVRDALGTTRKYLLPLLGILDATGVTRRRGDVRIAGPRLPRDEGRSAHGT